MCVFLIINLLKMKKTFLILLSVLFFFSAKADEGMWMLPLIEKLNIQKMNGMGIKLTAEEIYSDKQISLKDAVVIFGNGCTGVMVSNQGLLFTNHHCGYDAIQNLSSVEHNYLKNGFTAKEISNEIPAPGLTVTFLNSIEDVTEKVLSQIPQDLNADKRYQFQDSICRAIAEEVNDSTKKLTAQVRPFFSGNQFYLVVYQRFEDIRFAYAPPSSIGKFGGDTDNWMWPRHTGDFSVFRVYSSPEGLPAEYSENNIPYSPKRFAKVSIKGYQPDDFAMIMGYPGSTSRYLTSWGIESRMNTGNQARIEVRGVKQDIWKSFMQNDEAIQLAYASKYARSSNYWKNSIGMNKAIQKLNIIERKQEEEKNFAKWAGANPERKTKYAYALKDLEDGYTKIYPYRRALNYLNESLLSGVELPRIVSQIYSASGTNVSTDSLLKIAKSFYHDYYTEVDKATFVAMLKTYRQSVSTEFLPDIYNTIDKKFKGDYQKYVNNMFDKSVFTSYEEYSKAFGKKKINFEKDPAYQFYISVRSKYFEIGDYNYQKLIDQIEEAERVFEAGLLEITVETGKPMYPDANFTMRLTYGKVGGYEPGDAVDYRYYTTPKGIIEKEIPGDMEFDVPASLKKAIVEKDYQKYIDAKTGELQVNFLTNNDITGGNSGSPVFNGKGELLGLAFDGNWEAMSGDIVFEPELQRCINVDVRYMLFIMDKIGGAHRLIEELELN